MKSSGASRRQSHRKIRRSSDRLSSTSSIQINTGVIVYTRVMNGSAKKRDRLKFKIADKTFEAIEVGIFSPDNTPTESLSAGENRLHCHWHKRTGYCLGRRYHFLFEGQLPALPGYNLPGPVVWHPYIGKSGQPLAFKAGLDD